MRKINDAGLKLIKKWEGCSLKVYLDVAGHRTIGYGHMNDKMPTNNVITQEQADELLEKDLTATECSVVSFVRAPLNDNQFSALVAFVFNVGASKFKASTMCKLLNARNYDAAALEFAKWNHADGKVVDGLTNRRAAEKELFTS